jgi:hypothetical protein
MAHASDLRSGRHVLDPLHAHVVFLPQDRRGVITERVFAMLRAAWEGVCKVALATLVNSLKSVSARRVRAANLPEVQRKL